MIAERQSRSARLLGEEALERLGAAHALVVGLGGVGSAAAEGLARAGVGRITLVDFDRVAETDRNRQLCALGSTLGAPKAEVVARRLVDINPELDARARVLAFSAATTDELLGEPPDVVVDAIDAVADKLLLIATCVARRIPLVTVMGAASRLDPTRLRVADLARTSRDPFARVLRKQLRRKHGLSCAEPLGVVAVFSDEPPRDPGVPIARSGEARPPVIEGSMPFVPIAAGVTAAGCAVQILLGRVGPRNASRDLAQT